MQPKNASMFRYSSDRPSLYSASEQAMNDVATGLSGTTGQARTGSSRNCGMYYQKPNAVPARLTATTIPAYRNAMVSILRGSGARYRGRLSVVSAAVG